MADAAAAVAAAVGGREEEAGAAAADEAAATAAADRRLRGRRRAGRPGGPAVANEALEARVAVVCHCRRRHATAAEDVASVEVAAQTATSDVRKAV